MEVTGNSDLSKLRRVSRYGSWILAVAFVCLAIIIVIGVVAVITCLNDPSAVVGPMPNEVAISRSIFSILNGVFGSALCYEAYRLMRSFQKGGSPFTEENARGIRSLSMICAIAFVVVLAAQLLLSFVIYPEDYAMQFPAQFLVMSAVVYIIYLLFGYGVALQTESDGFL